MITVSRERPPEPEHLTPAQKRVWRSIVTDLEKQGILAQSDGLAIEAVAILLGMSDECSAHSKKVGRWTDEGRKTIEFQIRLLAAARPWIKQLTLSPRGRA